MNRKLGRRRLKAPRKELAVPQPKCSKPNIDSRAGSIAKLLIANDQLYIS